MYSRFSQCSSILPAPIDNAAPATLPASPPVLKHGTVGSIAGAKAGGVFLTLNELGLCPPEIDTMVSALAAALAAESEVASANAAVVLALVPPSPSLQLNPPWHS